MHHHAALVLLFLVSLATAAKTSLKASHYDFPMQQSSYEYGLFRCRYTPGMPDYDHKWLQLVQAIFLAALFHTHQLYSDAPSKQGTGALTISCAGDILKTHHQMYIAVDLIRAFLPSANLYDVEASIDGLARAWMVKPLKIFSLKQPVLSCTIPLEPKSTVVLTVGRLDKNLQDRCVMLLQRLQALPVSISKGTKLATVLAFGPVARASYLKLSVKEILHNLCFSITKGTMSVKCTQDCSLLSFALIKQRFPVLAIPPGLHTLNFHYSQGRFGPKRSWNRIFVSILRCALHRMDPEIDKNTIQFTYALLGFMHQFFPDAVLFLDAKPKDFEESLYCRLTGDAGQVTLADSSDGKRIYVLQFDPKQLAASDGVLQAMNIASVGDGFAITPLLHPPSAKSLRHHMLQIIDRVVLEQRAFDAIEPFILRRLLLCMHLGIPCSKADTDAQIYALPTEHFALILTAFPQLVSSGSIVAMARKTGRPIVAKIDLLLTSFESGDGLLSFLKVHDSGPPFQMLPV